MQVNYEIDQSILLFYIDDELWGRAEIAIFGKKPDIPKQIDSIVEFENLFLTLEYKGAKLYAYKKLASKNIPSFELAQLLAKKRVSEKNSKKIIQELLEQGHINDEEWTQSFIRYQSLKKFGPKAILQKLRLKGCKEPHQFLVDVQQPETQNQAILKLISKKYSSRDLSNKYERDKVIAALMRKGYDLDVILQTLKT